MKSKAYSSMPVGIHNLCNTLGSRVRIARTRRRLTQQDFASRVGTTRQTIQRLEAGDPTVGLGIFLTAAWVLGLHQDLENALDPARDMVGLREDFRRMPQRVRQTTAKGGLDPDRL
jgi:transcriptional regulator with XRE-family HTH domain